MSDIDARMDELLAENAFLRGKLAMTEHALDNRNAYIEGMNLGFGKATSLVNGIFWESKE